MNTCTLWCFCHLLIAINAVPLDYSASKEWNSFKTKFSKSYSSETEEKLRYKVFLENKRTVDLHNEKFRNGEVTYKMGLNHFSDLLFSEFRNRATGGTFDWKMEEERNSKTTVYFQARSGFSPPSDMDWTTKGAVTPIESQGDCGSCWAFSATGALEGQYFIKKGTLVSLSKQNLVDCSSDYGNFGCNGGNMTNAFAYVKDNGIATNVTYPYTAEDDQCKTNISKSNVTISGYTGITFGDEEKLKTAVATVGPISVAIEVDISFQNYAEGIYYGDDCSSDPEDINHAVLVVGYGTENGTDYWLVKNSWGTDWGMKGYIKMSRNKNNNCGIASFAVYPNLT